MWLRHRRAKSTRHRSVAPSKPTGARNLSRIGADTFRHHGASRLHRAEIEIEEGAENLAARSYVYDIFGNRTSALGGGAIGPVSVQAASNRLTRMELCGLR